MSTLAALQLNLPDVQEKLFHSVFWPFCLADARNLLVVSQQADFLSSIKVSDLWFMLRVSCSLIFWSWGFHGGGNSAARES